MDKIAEAQNNKYDHT